MANSAVKATQRAVQDSGDQSQQLVLNELKKAADIEWLIKRQRGWFYCDLACLEMPKGCFPDGQFPESGADLTFGRLGYKPVIFGEPVTCQKFALIARAERSSKTSLCADSSGAICESRPGPNSDGSCACLTKTQ